MQVVLGGITLLVLGVGAQLSDDLSREQLKPLTAFRQQHRRLVRLRRLIVTRGLENLPCAWFVAGRWSAVCRSFRAGHRTSCNSVTMARDVNVSMT